MTERRWSLVAAVLFSLFLVPALWAEVESAGVGVVAAAYLVSGAVAVAVAEEGRWPRLIAAYEPLGLGLALVGVLGAETAWLLASALAVLAVLRPLREAAVVTGLVLGGLLVAGAPTDTVVVLVAVAGATVLAVALADANTRLRAAQAEIDRLVVARERARMSRDLHDVLGHSLTTIVVKSGLARQLLAAGRVDRAADEVAGVESLARDAVADVRTTVADARETTLAGELAAARTALAAAGISASLPTGVDGVRASLRQPFAYVLREGVTNVVRHSGASHVTVTLEPDRITVRDDGPGTGPLVEGTGLRGLRERLAAAGASLEAGRGPDGFALTARAVR